MIFCKTADSTDHITDPMLDGKHNAKMIVLLRFVIIRKELLLSICACTLQVTKTLTRLHLKYYRFSSFRHMLVFTQLAHRPKMLIVKKRVVIREVGGHKMRTILFNDIANLLEL